MFVDLISPSAHKNLVKTEERLFTTCKQPFFSKRKAACKYKEKV